MAYVGYVTKIKNLRPHGNADRLQLGECFGNTVCVSLDYAEDQVCVYFPTDGQLSIEFAEYNNLLRKKDAEGNNIGGYMDPDKRNVTTIRLRGEKSDGLCLPLSCLDYCYPDVNGGAAVMLNVGDTIDIVNGYEICQKYIPKRTVKVGRPSEGNKVHKKKLPVAPLFAEHADTEQLAYNLGAFKCGDLVEITLKMHGTSQRTAYVPVLKGYKRTLADKIFRREGTPIYDWGYVSGTRRTVLEDFEGGFYGSNAFREEHSKFFEGKLLAGESVYYEVVGFVSPDVPIMADADNKKTNDKDFIKMYGKTTRFSYGCNVGESKTYVYRMTMTNKDGDVVEYSPDYMRYRCEQMGAECVQVFDRFIIPEGVNAGEYVLERAEKFYDGPDPVGKTHVREGVVCRIVNRPKFAAYKYKNFNFKILSGIAIAQAEKNGILDNISQDILEEL